MKNLRGLPRKQFLELIALLPVAVLLEACTKALGINVTSTVSPTEKITPSNTPKPTNTIRPSDTPTPTDTPTATNTPTNTPTKTPSPTLTTEQQHPGWTKVLAKEIGLNQESFVERNPIYNYTHPVHACHISMITDGYVITEPTQITTTDGEVLGTMLAGSRVYYLDAEGKLQSVIRPRILQLPSGNFFAYNLNYDYITEEKKNELLQDTDYLQATFGQLVGAILTSDMANLWEEWISIYQITFRSFYEMKDQVLKFENSKRELLQRFLQSGDPSIQLIFPFQEFAGKVRILKLPRS